MATVLEPITISSAIASSDRIVTRPAAVSRRVNGFIVHRPSVRRALSAARMGNEMPFILMGQTRSRARGLERPAERRRHCEPLRPQQVLLPGLFLSRARASGKRSRSGRLEVHVPVTRRGPPLLSRTQCLDRFVQPRNRFGVSEVFVHRAPRRRGAPWSRANRPV